MHNMPMEKNEEKEDGEKTREKFANTTSSTKNFNKCAKISQHCPKMDRQTAIAWRGRAGSH